VGDVALKLACALLIVAMAVFSAGLAWVWMGLP